VFVYTALRVLTFLDGLVSNFAVNLEKACPQRLGLGLCKDFGVGRC